MSTFVLQPSFTAGELSPLLYSRVDLEKYHSGAARMRNFFVDYRGGASTRAGTTFIGEALYSTEGQPRLIPFIVSTIATYVLEFGNEYIRFIANEAFIVDPGTGLPLVIASPYAVEDLPLLKYAQSANVLTLTHPKYPVYNLTRTSATAFNLAADVIEPDIGQAPSVTVTQVNAADAKSLYGYIITAVDGNGKEGLGSYPAYVAGSILNQNTGIVNDIAWVAVEGAAAYRVYKAGPTPTAAAGTSAPPSTTFGYIGTSPTVSFVDNNIAPDYSSAPPQYQDPFSPGEAADLSPLSMGFGYAGVLTSLTFTGGGGFGATGYGIIDQSTGQVVGTVLTRPGKNYVTVPTVTDDQTNTATYHVDLGQLNGTYPAAVGYFQQRRVFGGTTNLPESFVASQSGDYNNFNTTPIALPTDAITGSLASREVNAIKAIVPVSAGLIILTTGGGFLVTGGANGSAITPADVVALPQPSSGCNDMPPLVINNDLLYCQNRGSVVRDLAYSIYVQSYTGTDRSVLASHLFTGYQLREWCYAEEPFRMVHVVRSDGRLLNFTYVPEQEIFAWTSADTNGLFCSIASIPEGQENAVYVVVQRYIQGAWKYYIERFGSRIFTNIADALCLDCALQWPQVNPLANLFPSAASGSGVNFFADDFVFTITDVGKVIWGNTGRATITAYVNARNVTVDIDPNLPFQFLPNDPDHTAVPISLGEWAMDLPVSTVSGLDHLEGKAVAALADGVPILDLTVIGGSVTLPEAATKINVGLPYMCQLQTLRIDVGEPTQQGKRKLITGVTARVVNTLGLQAGQDFDNLYDMEGVESVFTPGIVMTTGDIKSLVQCDWNTEGQLCFEQSAPLPATILGLIPEVTFGDTMR